MGIRYSDTLILYLLFILEISTSNQRYRDSIGTSINSVWSTRMRHPICSHDWQLACSLVLPNVMSVFFSRNFLSFIYVVKHISKVQKMFRLVWFCFVFFINPDNIQRNMLLYFFGNSESQRPFKTGYERLCHY